jgi:hypothetical protein
LDLADPEPASADQIDVLLGAVVFADIICDGLRKGSSLQPIAQKTVLGWILVGPCDSTGQNKGVTTHQGSVGDSLNALVRRFWEQEELSPASIPLTPEEREEIFATTHACTPLSCGFQ